PAVVVRDELPAWTARQRPGPLLRPYRIRSGHLDVRSRRSRPAELRIERRRAPRWRKQHDGWRMRIDRLVIFDQQYVIEAAALERDRARNARGCDRDARGSRQRGFPGSGTRLR